MRILVIGILAAALTGCAQQVRDRPLAGIDFADPSTLAALQNALPLDERGALGTYALLHWPKSRYYCGKPPGRRGRVPITIGDAIDLTRAYEAELEFAQAATPIASSQSIGTSREAMLIDRIEQLVLQRDRLYLRTGAAGDAAPQATQINDELNAIREELNRLRNSAAASRGQNF